MTVLVRNCLRLLVLTGTFFAACQGQASSIAITGVPLGSGFSGYGSAIGKHNVVEFGPSGISDPLHGAGWRIGGNVLSNVSNYAIDWYFNGAESGDQIYFASGLVNRTEHDENNRTGNNNHGFQFLGTTIGAGAALPLPFTLTDLTTGGAGTIALAFVEPKYRGHSLVGWKITQKLTDWFVFGFNDSGSSDHDYDDYVGIGHLRALPPPAPTPLPGALPLMASALGSGFLLARWRRVRAASRRKSKTPSS
jgi:hypothetical protein